MAPRSYRHYEVVVVDDHAILAAPIVVPEDAPPLLRKLVAAVTALLGDMDTAVDRNEGWESLQSEHPDRQYRVFYPEGMLNENSTHLVVADDQKSGYRVLAGVTCPRAGEESDTIGVVILRFQAAHAAQMALWLACAAAGPAAPTLTLDRDAIAALLRSIQRRAVKAVNLTSNWESSHHSLITNAEQRTPHRTRMGFAAAEPRVAAATAAWWSVPPVIRYSIYALTWDPTRAVYAVPRDADAVATVTVNPTTGVVRVDGDGDGPGKADYRRIGQDLLLPEDGRRQQPMTPLGGMQPLARWWHAARSGDRMAPGYVVGETFLTAHRETLEHPELTREDAQGLLNALVLLAPPVSN